MLDKFAEELIAEKGLEDLDPEVRNSLISEIKAKANELINAKIVNSMNEEQLQKFNRLIDTSPTETEVQAFIADNVPNKHAIAASALMEFKMLYLGLGS